MADEQTTTTVSVPSQPWGSSWTLVINSVTVLAEIGQMLAGASIIPPGVGTIVLACTNILLRALKTTSPLSFTGKATQEIEVTDMMAKTVFNTNRHLFLQQDPPPPPMPHAPPPRPYGRHK